MIKKFVIIFALSFAAAIAFAQQPPGGHPSYVTIQMLNDPLDSAPTMSTICGGAVVDESKKLIATAWHCVPNKKTLIGKPCFFTAGKMNAKLVAFEAMADIALFQVDDLKGLKALKFKTKKKETSLLRLLTTTSSALLLVARRLIA